MPEPAFPYPAFVRFSRPHTVIGTTLSIAVVTLLAVLERRTADPHTSQVAAAATLALATALPMNIYIVGLNQLFDIPIDKINKPYLPLASGEYSVPFGWAVVLGCFGVSVGAGVALGSPALLYTLLGSAVLGTAYSVDLPLLRWKRNALLASMCILIIRALVVQIGFYSHIRQSVPQLDMPPWTESRATVFGVGFMTVFSIVIAFFKDIPDVDGDRRNNVQSLSVRLGTDTVFRICIGMLLALYTGAALFALGGNNGGGSYLACAAHFALAGLTVAKARAVDLAKAASIWSYYMFIWKLFYLEYCLLPLMG